MTRLLMILLIISALLGCSTASNDNVTGHTGDQPPQAVIQIANNSYETILGTYCWSSNNQSTCVDKAGPAELLHDVNPVTVEPGAEITFVMNYNPQPNQVYVEQFSDGEHMEVAIIDNTFHAPVQKGVYYYSYGVWWMDENKENVSNGDAFYNFVIEVK